MVATPLALAFILRRAWHLGWRLWLIGGATFILSQVGHIPFNLLINPLLFRPLLALPAATRPLANAVFLGLSAGLFEELCRAGMFRWWAKDARSWRKGILTGAGHGGAEAILLGLLAFVALIQLTAYRTLDLATIIKDPFTLEIARAQVAAYWSASWYDSLLGAFERAFTIPVQISLAVIVLQAFTRRQWWWVALAVLYHAVIDATAVLALPALGAYWTEAIVAGFSFLSIAIIFLLRKPEPAPTPISPIEPVPAVETMVPKPKPVEETPEKLDASRYE
jgi:uncharacterized membrane protein YhfC